MLLVLDGKGPIRKHGKILETVPQGIVSGETALIDHLGRKAIATLIRNCRIFYINE